MATFDVYVTLSEADTVKVRKDASAAYVSVEFGHGHDLTITWENADQAKAALRQAIALLEQVDG